jgi:uncharacterized protein (DUF924 family)
MRVRRACRARLLEVEMISPDQPPWIDEVLRFWFDEVGPGVWFKADPALDERIRRAFGHRHADLAAHASVTAIKSPSEALATIIVLDQFSRNLYRGSPAAFACDPLALSIAEAAVDAGFDHTLDLRQRVFMYMPLEHSEDRAVQARSVRLFRSLDDSYFLKYAQEHRDIVERFGRFPHRNRILDRTSTAAELQFLKEHPGF